MKVVAGGIAAVVAIAVILIPFVPITAQEEYTEMETRQESYVDIETKTEEYTVVEKRREAYTDVEYRTEEYTDVEYSSEPYTVVVPRSEIAGSIEDMTIEAGDWRTFGVYVQSGQSVELRVSASDTLDTYVISKSAYEANGNSYGEPTSKEDEVRYGFTAPITDTYYFAFYNHHDGFFSSKSIGLYSAIATLNWEEEVTNYKDVQVPVTKERSVKVPVTKYKEVEVPVTKTRDVQVPVTKYRDVEVAVVKVRDVPKNVSLLDFLQARN
jgi:hypothetical protein